MNKHAIIKTIQDRMIELCTLHGLFRDERYRELTCTTPEERIDMKATWQNCLANVPHDTLREAVETYCTFPVVMDLWAQMIDCLHDNDLSDNEFEVLYPEGFTEHYTTAKTNLLAALA